MNEPQSQAGRGSMSRSTTLDNTGSLAGERLTAIGSAKAMAAVFIHLSDIHFGQERGDRVHIHADVKEQLIADAAALVRTIAGGTATGILVTGDIAHSGKREEYVQAAAWLDRLAQAVGCEIFNIQLIPGNHDVDRDQMSGGVELMRWPPETGQVAKRESRP